MVEVTTAAAIGIGKNVTPSVHVQHTLVDVHGAAWFHFHRFGHKGGKNAVPQRGFTHGALEQKHPVGQVHRVAMAEVDLHLARTRFVNQRLHTEPVHTAKLREFHEKRVKVIDRVNRIRLPPRLSFAGAPQRRLQGFVRVVLACHQVELHLGGHHRPPTLLFVQGHHVAQHTAW